MVLFFISNYLTDNYPLPNLTYCKGLGHAILGNFSTDQIVIELTKI